jgi:hypothetical protein
MSLSFTGGGGGWGGEGECYSAARSVAGWGEGGGLSLACVTHWRTIGLALGGGGPLAWRRGGSCLSHSPVIFYMISTLVKLYALQSPHSQHFVIMPCIRILPTTCILTVVCEGRRHLKQMFDIPWPAYSFSLYDKSNQVLWTQFSIGSCNNYFTIMWPFRNEIGFVQHSRQQMAQLR